MMFLRDGQAEAGAGPPRGEVRVEDVRHVLGAMPMPRSRSDDDAVAVVASVRTMTPGRRRRRPAGGVDGAGRSSAPPAPRGARWSGC